MNDRGEDRGEKMGLLRQRTERKARVVRPCLHSDGIRQYRRAVTPLLLKQDDAPLFNSAHALGFFSIFNADAVDQISLYKGHIPAQYGGRLSSVLDVQLKDGNMRKWAGKGSIGFIASRMVFEGPIKKDKLSILIGGRQSYLGPALQQSASITIKDSKSAFNDGLLKLTWRVNAKNTFRLSGKIRGEAFSRPDITKITLKEVMNSLDLSMSIFSRY